MAQVVLEGRPSWQNVARSSGRRPAFVLNHTRRNDSLVKYRSRFGPRGPSVRDMDRGGAGSYKRRG